MLDEYNTEAVIKDIINNYCDIDLGPDSIKMDVSDNYYTVDVFSRKHDPTDNNPVKHTVKFRKIKFYDDNGNYVLIGFSNKDDLLDEYSNYDIHISYHINLLNNDELDRIKNNDNYTEELWADSMPLTEEEIIELKKSDDIEIADDEYEKHLSTRERIFDLDPYLNYSKNE